MPYLAQIVEQSSGMGQVCVSIFFLFWSSYKTNKKWGKNISDTLSCGSCAISLFLPHVDVICDLLLNRRGATWNLFLNIKKEIPNCVPPVCLSLPFLKQCIMNNSVLVIHGIINISFSVIPKTTHPIIVYKFRGIAYFALYSTQRTTFGQIHPLNYDALKFPHTV